MADDLKSRTFLKEVKETFEGNDPTVGVHYVTSSSNKGKVLWLLANWIVVKCH